MNPLWLLLIVPGAFLLGWCLLAAFERMEDYDKRRLRLIEQQYRELRAEGETYTPSVDAWTKMITRHMGERAELDK